MNKLGKSLPPLACLLPFEAAARLGSFSRAAEELHITQAAISRQIRALEEDLGTSLFERRNRGVFLTEAGRRFAYSLGNALGEIAEQANHIRGVAAANEVVLVCQMCEAFHWLMPRLSDFHQRYPEIELRVATLTRPLPDYGSYFDIAMQSSNRETGQHPLLFSASDEVFPVCSPRYLEKMGVASISLDQLDRHTFLHHQTLPPYQMEWDSWLAEHQHTLPGKARILTFDTYSLMLQAAVAGHGLAMGWRRTSQGMLDSGELVAPFAETVYLPDALSLYGRSGPTKRREAALLEEWLREMLGC
jgi:LysR family glycine cleavage system transcriptional activator